VKDKRAVMVIHFSETEFYGTERLIENAAPTADRIDQSENTLGTRNQSSATSQQRDEIKAHERNDDPSPS